MAEPYRILITGSRRMRDRGPILHAFVVWRELAGSGIGLLPLSQIVIVHGAGEGEDGAPGCDKLADELFRTEYPEITIEPHPADWKKYGIRAGPLRNKEMIDAGADVVLAFPSTNRKYKGTRGTIELAFDAGIPVHAYPVAV